MIIAWILFITAMALGTYVLCSRLLYARRRRQYLIQKKQGSPLKLLCCRLEKNNKVKRILDVVAIKIGIYNNYSMEKNREYAIVAILLLAITILVFFNVLVPAVSILWYVGVIYFILGFLFAALIIYMINSVVSLKFTLQLPEVYKILNSRYTTEADILKAIDISIEDFKGAVQREMIRIGNVLRKNNKEKINETFQMLDKMYDNEYFTLLLNLIHQAYYKGGREGIKKQFENITEEILTDIENRKDLIITSRMYMAFVLFVPITLPWLKRFNEAALGEKSAAYYQSAHSERMQLLLIITVLIYVGTFLYMERTT